MTATRTVLFTDLAGYTEKVSGTDREGLRRILREHEEMVRPIVERHGGRIVKNIGDSFLCMFPAATDGVRAALDIQHKTRGGDTPDIRISITTGDVEEIDGDAFGEPVNLAARILSITPAREIWFGIGTRVCMNDAEIPWENVGLFRLKGLPTEQECFRVVPPYKSWLPPGIAAAARDEKLVRYRKGVSPPSLPPDPVILLEGFEAGSPELEEAVGALPVLDPASFYLAAYNIPTAHRQGWVDAGYGLVIGTSESIDGALEEAIRAAERPAMTSALDDASTMLLDVKSRADLELIICGLALPEVPLSEVVASYSYELLADGSWVPRSEQAVARVEVRPDRVVFHALIQGISVGGSLLAPGESTPLQNDVTIAVPSGQIRYRAVNAGYKGLMVADTPMRLGVTDGQTAEIGRKPNPPGLAFPQREGQDNIRWCSGARAAKARSRNFTLDRVLTGRRQAAVTLKNGSIHLVPLHAECRTYVVHPPQGLQLISKPANVNVGDFIVAGTNVVGLRGSE